MALQQGEAAVGFVVVVGMALQVDEQPVRRLVCGVPRMARQDVFVFASAEVAAGQAVMLDVIDKLQLPDGDGGLQGEQGDALPAAKGVGEGQHGDLQGGVAPEGVGFVAGREVFAGQHCGFDAPRRARALPQDAGEIAVEAFVIAGGDGVFGGADVDVVDAQMFGAEVGIEDTRHQKIAQPTLRL